MGPSGLAGVWLASLLVLWVLWPFGVVRAIWSGVVGLSDDEVSGVGGVRRAPRCVVEYANGKRSKT